ncbi:hypothetical protein SAMN02745194_03077 [Roseomonas rosea]|uniref:Bacteriophage holin of superfamily 6 (Holin_LLH) n=1 Tax=Muricoccus roseus TaxID=198092 RepID=A0A1M6L7W5_9PROT|nr:hypothetical protein [Roseomonas rosea]SHJ67287.1 hypothetical protein SAMN02745194_03077 [Roseomonas rosea]
MDTLQVALVALTVAFLGLLTGLIPYLGAAAKAALVAYTESKHQAAINNAAETLAIKAEKEGVDPATLVGTLRQRLPDAMAALSPTDATLRDVLTKAGAKVTGRIAMELATGLEGRGA